MHFPHFFFSWDIDCYSFASCETWFLKAVEISSSTLTIDRFWLSLCVLSQCLSMIWLTKRHKKTSSRTVFQMSKMKSLMFLTRFSRIWLERLEILRQLAFGKKKARLRPDVTLRVGSTSKVFPIIWRFHLPEGIISVTIKFVSSFFFLFTIIRTSSINCNPFLGAILKCSWPCNTTVVMVFSRKSNRCWYHRCNSSRSCSRWSIVKLISLFVIVIPSLLTKNASRAQSKCFDKNFSLWSTCDKFQKQIASGDSGIIISKINDLFLSKIMSPRNPLISAFVNPKVDRRLARVAVLLHFASPNLQDVGFFNTWTSRRPVIFFARKRNVCANIRLI